MLSLPGWSSWGTNCAIDIASKCCSVWAVHILRILWKNNSHTQACAAIFNVINESAGYIVGKYSQLLSSDLVLRRVHSQLHAMKPSESPKEDNHHHNNHRISMKATAQSWHSRTQHSGQQASVMVPVQMPAVPAIAGDKLHIHMTYDIP